MLRLCSVRCPHMNEITLEDTLESLVKEQYEIEIDEEIRVKRASFRRAHAGNRTRRLTMDHSHGLRSRPTQMDDKWTQLRS